MVNRMRCQPSKEDAMIKVIDSIQYHVWSDALHARELARQTNSPWDRGRTCVGLFKRRGLPLRISVRMH